MNHETVRQYSLLLVIGLFCLGQGCSSGGGGGGRPASDDGSDGPATPPDPVDSTNSPDTSTNGDESPTPTDNSTDPSANPGGFRIIAAAALFSTEAGGSIRFSVVLDRAPADEVTLPIESTNLAEGTVSPGSLTFTSANWSTAQSVTVTGVDDFVDDGDVAFTITVGPAESADPDFDGLEAAEVTVTNRDNDVAGVTVLSDPGVETSEAGATAEFTIVLNSQPSAEVTIALSTSPASEIAVAPASVTFGMDDWDEPQVVTLTGLDDALEDGDATVTVVTGDAVSADAAYSGITVADLTVVNRDNDTQSFSIEPDDYPAGTVLTNVVAAVGLSTALDDNSIAELFQVTAADDGLDLEPTGERVFGHEGIQFFNSDRRLRMDFARPAKEIRILFAGGTFFETEVGVLQAFDANGVMLAEHTTSPRGAGDAEVMTVTRPTADIVWAVAYSQDSFGRLDYLVFTVGTVP